MRSTQDINLNGLNDAETPFDDYKGWKIKIWRCRKIRCKIKSNLSEI